MGAGISPVLQAFLAGQQQQQGLISQARQIQDAAQQREERKASLDEVIRQHGIEAKSAQDRLELEQQQQALEHKKAWMDAIGKFREGQQNESIPIQMLPGVDGSPTTTPNPMQIATNPFDPSGNSIVAPPPATKGTIAQRAADIAQNRYEQTVAVKDAADRQAKAEQGDKDRELRKQMADDKVQMMQQHNDAMAAIGLGNIQHRQELDEAKLTAQHGGLAPDEFAAQVEANAHDIALGQKHLNDVKLPAERAHTERRLAELGAVDTPPKSVDTLMNAAGTAASYLSAVENMKNIAGQGNKAGNSIRGMLTDFGGLSSLSPNRSEFDAIVKPAITQLESAQGISLARGGSSPGFFKLQTGMQPRINDDPNVIDFKGTSGAHLLLSEAAKSISNLPVGQQKALWRVIVDKYPTLLDNPVLAQKLVGKGGATNAGKYDLTNPKVEDFNAASK